MKQTIIEFVVFLGMWMGFAYLLGMTPLDQWPQGAFTAMFTTSVHRFLFD